MIGLRLKSRGACIRTERLDLIAGTLEMVRAEIHARRHFAELLDAIVPAHWPPELNDEQSMAYGLRVLSEAPHQAGWWCWYFVLRQGPDGRRIVIGNGGIKGPPMEDGTVEVGYSLLNEFRGSGYATEAVRGLVGWAFEHEQVQRVIAETLPDITSSIRVLERSGFRLIGDGAEPGVIRFELSRASWKAEKI